MKAAVHRNISWTCLPCFDCFVCLQTSNCYCLFLLGLFDYQVSVWAVKRMLLVCDKIGTSFLWLFASKLYLAYHDYRANSIYTLIIRYRNLQLDTEEMLNILYRSPFQQCFINLFRFRKPIFRIPVLFFNFQFSISVSLTAQSDCTKKYSIFFRIF